MIFMIVGLFKKYIYIYIIYRLQFFGLKLSGSSLSFVQTGLLNRSLLQSIDPTNLPDSKNCIGHGIRGSTSPRRALRKISGSFNGCVCVCLCFKLIFKHQSSIDDSVGLLKLAEPDTQKGMLTLVE